MKPIAQQLQLDYPAWRLSFSAYGEHLGLSETESASQWYDERVFDGEDAEEWQRRSEEQGGE